LGLASLSSIAAGIAFYLAQRWIGIALHYQSLEELRDLNKDANAGRIAAAIVFALSAAPLAFGLYANHSVTITLSSFVLIVAVVPYLYAAKLVSVIGVRRRHILKIMSQEHHGSSTTIKALRGMKGPGSTLPKGVGSKVTLDSDRTVIKGSSANMRRGPSSSGPKPAQ
jgi:hypothetical protein